MPALVYICMYIYIYIYIPELAFVFNVGGITFFLTAGILNHIHEQSDEDVYLLILQMKPKQDDHDVY